MVRLRWEYDGKPVWSENNQEKEIFGNQVVRRSVAKIRLVRETPETPLIENRHLRLSCLMLGVLHVHLINHVGRGWCLK